MDITGQIQIKASKPCTVVTGRYGKTQTIRREGSIVSDNKFSFTVAIGDGDPRAGKIKIPNKSPEYLVKNMGKTTAYVINKKWMRMNKGVIEESDDKENWSKVEISWETYE